MPKARAPTPAAKAKLEPLGWSSHREPMDYVQHLLVQLGRLEASSVGPSGALSEEGGDADRPIGAESPDRASAGGHAQSLGACPDPRQCGDLREEPHMRSLIVAAIAALPFASAANADNYSFDAHHHCHGANGRFVSANFCAPAHHAPVCRTGKPC